MVTHEQVREHLTTEYGITYADVVALQELTAVDGDGGVLVYASGCRLGDRVSSFPAGVVLGRGWDRRKMRLYCRPDQFAAAVVAAVAELRNGGGRDLSVRPPDYSIGDDAWSW